MKRKLVTDSGGLADADLDPFHRPLDGECVPYLKQRGLKYEKGKTLVDVHGYAVMMEWERSLMAAHAAYVVGDGTGKVLNIGHGMGIVDEEIQACMHATGQHFIVEAHEEVYPRAKQWAGECKLPERVTVVRGMWQTIDWDAIGFFDGVFFDTYEETVEDFFPVVRQILKPEGRFSFYNVYQPHDALRHVAYSAYLRACLAQLGLDCSYHIMNVHCPPEDWEGIACPYWQHQSYLVPHCTFHEECPASLDRACAKGTGLMAGTCGCCRRPLYGLDPVQRSVAGLETGEPLNMLLFKAKHWEVVKLVKGLGAQPQHDAESILSEIWDKCRCSKSFM